MGQTGQIRFVFAASYGLEHSGRPNCPEGSPASTPICPSPEMIVTLQHRPLSACLSLSPDEYDELWRNFVAHYNLTFQSDMIKNLVYFATGTKVNVLAVMFI